MSSYIGRVTCKLCGGSGSLNKYKCGGSYNNKGVCDECGQYGSSNEYCNLTLVEEV